MREVWLSSEDTGAYGRDIGTDLPALLRALVAVLPQDGRTMLRVGMTNPPYVLRYLEELTELLSGGNGKEGSSSPSPLLPIFRFLHVPVQSGSDAVLAKMRREYSVADFEAVAAAVEKAGATLATDVIVGFPGETAEDAAATVELVNKWKPRATHVSKFYPRPGTPAAKWERPPAREVAARSRAVAAAVDNLDKAWDHLVNSIQRVWVVDVATDGDNLVAHTRDYAQVLLPRRGGRGRGKDTEGESEVSDTACLGASLGDVLDVFIESASRWSVRGRVVRILLDGDEAREEALRLEEGVGFDTPERGDEREKKGEAVVPAPRRTALAAAAAAAPAAAASAGPASPPPPRPETPEAPPAAPRARAGQVDAEEEREASDGSEVKAAAVSFRPRSYSLSPSLLLCLLALAVAVVSFSVAVALRGRAEERGEIVVAAAEETLPQ